MLVIAWIVSVLFRMQDIQKQPDFTNTAHIFMLTALDIWNADGAARNNFAMNTTYSNPGDLNVSYYERLMTEDGRNFYVSHTPFAILFAYAFTGFGFFAMSNAGLQILLFFLQLVSVLFVFKLLLSILENKKYKFEISFFASIIYLFHPLVLYQYTYHYFAESFGQLFFIVFLFYWQKITKKHDSISVKKGLLIFALSFLFVYSEWLGVFFLASLFLIYYVFSNKDRGISVLVFSALAGGIVAVSLFVFQHLSLASVEVFVRALGIRFLERSGFFGNEYTDMGYSYSNPDSYLLLCKQLLALFKGTGLLFLVVLIFAIRQIKYEIFKNRIFLLSVLSCVFYFIIFFSATITHYIYMSKFLVPLLIFSSLIFADKRIERIFSTRILKNSFFAIFGLFMLLSFYLFRDYTNRNVKEKNEHFLELENFANKNINPENSIFIKIPDEMSYADVVYLSYSIKRNVAVANNETEVLEFLERKDLNTALYFYYDEHNVLRVKSIKNNN